MSSKDAYMFPVIGSAVLFGLFLAFMLISKEYVNLVLTIYFLGFGIGALTSTISPILNSLMGKTKKDETHISFKPPWSKEKISFDFTIATLICLVFSIVFCVWYAFTKNWIANNILGTAFSVQAVALISPGTYQTGCILLGLLFFYDIFWVFGTDVMVTVAKSFDGPIKLLFPKNVFSGAELEFSMLGLGDIVLPGLFIAFLLRFDISRGKKSKTYFYICLLSYFLGLLSTIAVMHIFRHAQPALLYLVPFCLISSFLTAVVRGEVGLLLAYTEDKKEEEKKEKEEKEKEDKKTN